MIRAILRFLDSERFGAAGMTCIGLVIVAVGLFLGYAGVCGFFSVRPCTWEKVQHDGDRVRNADGTVILKLDGKPVQREVGPWAALPLCVGALAFSFFGGLFVAGGVNWWLNPPPRDPHW